jgi:lactate dehydrogenase-like 2-hydroxyacid dehydrogenase
LAASAPSGGADRPALVLLDSPALSHLVASLEPEFEVINLWDDPDPAALLARRGRQVRIAFGGGSSARLPAEVIAALPKLGLIARVGTGYDGVDLAFARSRGIAVTNTPGVNAADVADMATALLLALARGIPQADRRVREGLWRGEPEGPAVRAIGDLRVGIMGLGAIGAGVAARLAPFGCDVRWWGPNAKPDARWPRARSLVDLAAWADALVVCARADASNGRAVDAAVLAALGPGGLPVNVARGSLLDEDELFARLRRGALAGAALDVFGEEPARPARWRDVPNVILTPHIAGHTERASRAILALAVANMRAFLAGRPLITPVPQMGTAVRGRP